MRKQKKKHTVLKVILLIVLILLLVATGGAFWVYQKFSDTVGEMNYRELESDKLEINQQVKENKALPTLLSSAWIPAKEIWSRPTAIPSLSPASTTTRKRSRWSPFTVILTSISVMICIGKPMRLTHTVDRSRQ